MRRRRNRHRGRRQLGGAGRGVSGRRSCHVNLLVRGPGLSETMSQYLIRRIEDTPSIKLMPFTEIESLEGDSCLATVRWRNSKTGETVTKPIGHLFLMTGAVPNTAWLDGCLALDEKRFVRTGPDIAHEDLTDFNWPLRRPPYLLETSPAARVCGGRRARRQCQARRLGRRRGFDRHPVRASGACRVRGAE